MLWLMHTLTYTARMDKMYTISYDNVSRKRKQLKKNLVVHFGFCLVQLRLTPIETTTIWIHTEMHTAHAKMMSKSLASKFQMSEPAIQFKCENKCVETNPNCNICVTQFTDFCSLFYANKTWVFVHSVFLWFSHLNLLCLLRAKIAALLLDTNSGLVESLFHHFVWPTHFPTLCDYCTKQTGLSQSFIDQLKPFSNVCNKCLTWLCQHIVKRNLVFASPLNSQHTHTEKWMEMFRTEQTNKQTNQKMKNLL